MPYRRTKSVDERLADNRARILRAARQLVAEGGFRQVHVATVARPCRLVTTPAGAVDWASPRAGQRVTNNRKAMGRVARRVDMLPLLNPGNGVR